MLRIAQVDPALPVILPIGRDDYIDSNSANSNRSSIVIDSIESIAVVGHDCPMTHGAMFRVPVTRLCTEWYHGLSGDRPVSPIFNKIPPLKGPWIFGTKSCRREAETEHITMYILLRVKCSISMDFSIGTGLKSNRPIHFQINGKFLDLAKIEI